jgi:hypothetical protein
MWFKKWVKPREFIDPKNLSVFQAFPAGFLTRRGERSALVFEQSESLPGGGQYCQAKAAKEGNY